MHLGRRLDQKEILVAPGVYDALTATIAEQAGFEAAYLSGASIAYTRLGRPDIGLVSMTEVADVLACVRDRVELELIADADTGFGNALDVQRTVRAFERAGADGIQLEDQTTPKRCGHLRGKTLVGTGEMVGKIKAALDSRRSADTLIIARTDAIAVDGPNAAIERAEAYLEAGADVLFLEAPETIDQLRTVCRAFAGRAPLMANMVEGGRTPFLAAAELEQLGFSLVIFPGGLARALAHAARRYLETLREHGTSASLADSMLDFDGLNRLLDAEPLTRRGPGSKR